MAAIEPVRWRSSGMRAMPRAMAARGDQAGPAGRAGEAHLAGGGGEGAGDQVGERRLAVAGDAGEAGDAAARQGEVDAVQAGGRRRR